MGPRLCRYSVFPARHSVTTAVLCDAAVQSGAVRQWPATPPPAVVRSDRVAKYSRNSFARPRCRWQVGGRSVQAGGRSPMGLSRS